MSEWLRDRGVLRIVHGSPRPFRMFFVAVGLVIAGGAGLSLLSGFMEHGPRRDMAFTGLVFMSGLHLIYFALTRLAPNEQTFAEIARDDIRFGRDLRGEPAILDLGDVTRIELLKTFTREHSEGPLTYRYKIFLRGRNGTFWWLDTYGHRAHFGRAVAYLRAYLGLEVRDHTGLGLEHPPMTEYPPAGIKQRAPLSEFMNVDRDETGIRISSRGARNLWLELANIAGTIITGVLIWLYFFNFGSTSSWIFTLIDFGLVVFFAFQVLSLLMDLGKIELHIARGLVGVRTRFPGILAFLNHTVEIESRHIRSAGVNRWDEGRLALTLLLDSKKAEKTRGSIFARAILQLHELMSQSKTKQPGIRGRVREIWALPAHGKPGRGPTFDDLRHVEDLLEGELHSRPGF